MSFTQGVTVNLASGAVVGDEYYLGNDTLLGIESVVGTILADAYDATGFNGASANAGSYGSFNEFQGRGGDDRVVGNGNTRVSYVDAYAGVSVNLASGISSSLEADDIAQVGIDAISGVNAVKGSAFGDVLIGSITDDMLEGRGGDDSITGGVGNDRINGGVGSDTAVYAGDLNSVISIGRSADGLSTLIKTLNEGTDTLTNIEFLKFGTADAISLVSTMETLRAAPVFTSMRIDLNASRSDGVEMIEGGTFGGESSEAQLVNTSTAFVMPDFYTGPVEGVDFQLIDTSDDAVIVGSAFNDFIVLQGTGNKAVDGGEGSDIIGGGTGSNFVTGGGSGIADTFFFDGRATGTSWSTITDFELGLDKATIWGWKKGVSRVFALDAERGAADYTGLTLHFENLLPDGASATDTNPNLNSITLTGLKLSDFGASSLEELNAQIANQTNSHFVVSTVSDVHGDHGYLLIS
jgi:Ca2+-binding RTX toxin-like protein